MHSRMHVPSDDNDDDDDYHYDDGDDDDYDAILSLCKRRRLNSKIPKLKSQNLSISKENALTVVLLTASVNFLLFYWN